MPPFFQPLLSRLKACSGLNPTPLAEWIRNMDFSSIGFKVYPRSIQRDPESLWFLGQAGEDRAKWLVGIGAESLLKSFEGTVQTLSPSLQLGVFPCSPPNAGSLRRRFDWLRPRPFGLQPTFGCGDRLGLATPGHLRAATVCGTHVLVAQQSIREMTRTQRTPQQVMDDAMWGVFQEGYTQGFGADADHLKTFADIEATAAAGFTMFTIDPSEYVERSADEADETRLNEILKKVDCGEWPIFAPELMEKYSGKKFDFPGMDSLTLTPLELKRAIAKYGRAIAWTEKMAQQVKNFMKGRPFDLEMSVDETDHPTTPAEHLFIGLELKRRKISVQSLAPRFVGEFQKGVDYIGDLVQFQQNFTQHVAIAKLCGPYKLSIHSGSDKFLIFPIIGKIAGPLVHEKTAGTSYLEALRVLAHKAPLLFREICHFCRERFPTDRATYHVVEKLDQLPELSKYSDSDLPGILENNQGRQMLHVTFGSVLNAKDGKGDYLFRHNLFRVLRENEETYAEFLEKHFIRHMRELGMGDKI